MTAALQPKEDECTISNVNARETLLRWMIPAGSELPPHSISEAVERLSPEEVKGFLDGIGKVLGVPSKDAEAVLSAARRAITTVEGSAEHRSRMQLAEQLTDQLLRLAQRVQTVFQSDIVVSKLTAEGFQQAALAAIRENDILRRAIQSIGRTIGRGVEAGREDHAPLETLMHILATVSIRLSADQDLMAVLQRANGKLNEETGRLNQKLAEAEARIRDANNAAGETVTNAINMTGMAVIVSSPSMAVLGYTGQFDSSRLAISNLTWKGGKGATAPTLRSPNSSNIIVFSSARAASSVLDKIVSLLTKDAQSVPEFDRLLPSVNVAGMPISSMRVEVLATIPENAGWPFSL